MSQQPAPSPHNRPTGLWVLIILILLPAVVVPLWVPLYDKTDPTLWGFPFFYWFQFALVLISVVLTAMAYAISLVADRRRRAGLAGDGRGGDVR